MRLDKQHLVALFDYHNWAWGRVIETAAELTDEQYLRTFSFGSIRSTLVHALFAESLWLARCKNLAPKPLYETDVPNVESLLLRQREHREK